MNARHASSLAILGIFLVLAYGTTGAEGEGTGGPAATGGARTGGETASVPGRASPESQMPWIATVQANCSRYQSAPNDIQKSAIFNENERLIRGQELSDIEGELTALRTDQGGETLRLEVDVGDVHFETDGFGGIPRRSPIYQAASTMREGQCVRISGRVTEAASVVERSKVCDLDYRLSFSSIGPCE